MIVNPLTGNAVEAVSPIYDSYLNWVLETLDRMEMETYEKFKGTDPMLIYTGLMMANMELIRHILMAYLLTVKVEKVDEARESLCEILDRIKADLMDMTPEQVKAAQEAVQEPQLRRPGGNMVGWLKNGKFESE